MLHRSRVAISLAAVLLASCTGRLERSGQQARMSQDPAVRWSPDVRFPEEDPSFHTATVEDDRLTFAFRGAPERTLAPGDLVVGAAGGGYVRRVTAVEAPDDETRVVQTEAAYLTDAMIDASLRLDEDSGLARPDDGLGDVGATAAPLGYRPPPIEVPLVGPVDGELSVEGHMSLQPSLELELEVAERRVQHLHYAVQLCGTAELTARARASVSRRIRVTVPVPTGLPTVPVALGTVPALVKFGAGVQLTAELEAGVEATVGVTGTICMTVGVDYDGPSETATPIFEVTQDLSPVGPDLGPFVGLQLEAHPRVQAGLFVLGLAGPYGRIGPTYGFNTTHYPLRDTVAWEQTAGVRARVGLALTLPFRLVPALPVASFDRSFGQIILASGEICTSEPCGCEPTAETCDGTDEDCDGAVDEGACGPTCGDGSCDLGEDCSTCGADCGACPPSCGDGSCGAGEDCSTCRVDCGACAPACGDGACNGSETCASCAADCGACAPSCGDGTCGVGEDCATCSADCGACAPSCGDGACGVGEDCATCSADCGACAPSCGDGACGVGEDCATCSADCGACAPSCGDGACDVGEDCATCSADCGACAPTCGDATCDAGEDCSTCSSDCGSCGTCTVPGHGGSGEHGDPCSSPDETWRCVWSDVNGAWVSQVCRSRSGAWESYRLSPVDCGSCCGEYTGACWAPP